MILASPSHATSTELASRATTTISLARVLEHLNAFQRLVTEGLAALPDPCTTGELAELIDQPRPSSTARLWISCVRSHCSGAPMINCTWFGEFVPRTSRTPGGWRHPLPRPLSVGEIEAALAGCDHVRTAGAGEAAAGLPSGALRRADRKVDPSAVATPIEQLLGTPVVAAAGLRDGDLAARGGLARPRRPVLG